MEPSPENSAPLDHLRPDTRTILVCEDDETLRELVRLALGEHHRFVDAADGDEAVAALHAERPDLVVLDLMLPRRSGREVVRELRATSGLADVPVVANGRGPRR